MTSSWTPSQSYEERVARATTAQGLDLIVGHLRPEFGDAVSVEQTGGFCMVVYVRRADEPRRYLGITHSEDGPEGTYHVRSYLDVRPILRAICDTDEGPLLECSVCGICCYDDAEDQHVHYDEEGTLLNPSATPDETADYVRGFLR